MFRSQGSGVNWGVKMFPMGESFVNSHKMGQLFNGNPAVLPARSSTLQLFEEGQFDCQSGVFNPSVNPTKKGGKWSARLFVNPATSKDYDERERYGDG